MFKSCRLNAFFTRTEANAGSCSNLGRVKLTNHTLVCVWKTHSTSSNSAIIDTTDRNTSTSAINILFLTSHKHDIYPKNDALSLVLPVADQLFSDKHKLTILTQPQHVLLALKYVLNHYHSNIATLAVTLLAIIFLSVRRVYFVAIPLTGQITHCTLSVCVSVPCAPLIREKISLKAKKLAAVCPFV